MYHSISERTHHKAHPYFGLEIPPWLFADHMRFLSEEGYQSISLLDVVDNLESTQQPQKKFVAITFDDGYGDFYSKGFPILQRYRFTASAFLPTRYIHRTPKKFKDKLCMTWQQVRELHKAGISFGSHTDTHPRLYGASPSQIEEELRVSKQRLEQELGAPVLSFSYPFAFPESDQQFTRNFRATLQRYGYKHGVTTVLRRSKKGDDPFFLPRLPVNAFDDLQLFRSKLEGGYDWLHTFQILTKAIRARSF